MEKKPQMSVFGIPYTEQLQNNAMYCNLKISPKNQCFYISALVSNQDYKSTLFLSDLLFVSTTF